MRRFAVATLLVGLVAGVVAPATASGPTAPVLLQAEPVDKAVLDKAPASISLTFSQVLDESHSRMEVFDACGNDVDSGDLVVTLNEMSIDLVKKPAGRYKVFYVAQAQPKGATGETVGFLKFKAKKGKACR